MSWPQHHDCGRCSPLVGGILQSPRNQCRAHPTAQLAKGQDSFSLGDLGTSELFFNPMVSVFFEPPKFFYVYQGDVLMTMICKLSISRST